MRRLTITIDEHTSKDQVLAEADRWCRSLSDPDGTLAAIKREVNDLVSRGQQLVAAGSQFCIKRTLSADDHAITIKASFGARLGLIARLRRALGF